MILLGHDSWGKANEWPFQFVHPFINNDTTEGTALLVVRRSTTIDECAELIQELKGITAHLVEADDKTAEFRLNGSRILLVNINEADWMIRIISFKQSDCQIRRIYGTDIHTVFESDIFNYTIQTVPSCMTIETLLDIGPHIL